MTEEETLIEVKKVIDGKESDADRLLRQKIAVVRVAQTLDDRGLIVRTWGNVSRRSDKDHFIITPSGVYTRDLKPERIVRVNLRTLSYRGKLRPSSEMALHAAIYLAQPEAGFIIHTHQPYASCASVLGEEEISLPHETIGIEGMEEIDAVPVAPYARPDTKDLAERATDTMKRHPDCPGVILQNHGIVCWGRNEREARTRAETIEILCYTYLADVCNTALQYGVQERFSSRREDGVVRYLDAGTPERVKRIHREIYARRPDINCVLHSDGEAERIVSTRFTELMPLFDDFAQIVGAGAKIPANERERPGDVISVKKDVNVVFSSGDGAFCLGSTREEAEACAKVVSKSCIAQIALTRTGRSGALSKRHCKRIHKKYLTDYMPLAEKYAKKAKTAS